MNRIEPSSGESCGGDGGDDDYEYEQQSDPSSTDEMVKNPRQPRLKGEGKKEKSPVWQHFEVVGGATKCRYCQQQFKSKQTSNLSRHLRKCKKVQLLTGDFCLSGDEVENIQVIELENEANGKRDETDVQGLPKVFVPEQKKRKSSAVWSHFAKADASTYKCNYCSRRFSIKNGSVSNLSRHLRNKHDFKDIEPAPSGTSVECSVELDELILQEDSPDRDHITYQSGPHDTRGSQSRHDLRETVSLRCQGLMSRSGTHSKSRYHRDDRRTLDFRDGSDQPSSLKYSRVEPIPDLSDFLRFNSPRRPEVSVPPKRTLRTASVANNSTDSASNAHYLLSLLPFMNALSPQENMEMRIEIQNAFSRRLFTAKKPPEIVQVVKTHSAKTPRQTSDETVQKDIAISDNVQDRAELGSAVQNEMFTRSQAPTTTETVRIEEVTENQCIQNEVVFGKNGQNEGLDQHPAQHVQDAFQYV